MFPDVLSITIRDQMRDLAGTLGCEKSVNISHSSFHTLNVRANRGEGVNFRVRAYDISSISNDRVEIQISFK